MFECLVNNYYLDVRYIVACFNVTNLKRYDVVNDEN